MSDSASKLEQELLGDARRQAERLANRARDVAAKAMAGARAEASAFREAQLAAARHEAEARARAVTAGASLEVRRHWLLRREEAFEGFFAKVLADLEAGVGIDRERSLRQLLREALEAVGSVPVVVRLGPAAGEVLTERVVAEVRREVWPQAPAGAGVQRVIDPTLAPGVVVESADGTRSFDNTYATRLGRLRGRLRALVAERIPATESDADA